ncbi:Multidrug resistance protein MdtE precursor [Rubripirellula amarantea]|uniref:Multidrug resistance protein MdtE n=1 Tax=Rubripirellula amarantea TaxID=2527999 RepID=A0A5C5WET7_9BACT|nr:efflux RND transporter periplasmic adaptor subunit [Rubripirellula amarantea]TWT49298.1 Multidrug resistance protein MdtE precursor [Rubripirellula amarantea]
MTKVRLENFLKPLSRWSVAIFGSLGVVLLLMMFAGVFTRKVSDEKTASVRRLESNMAVVEAREIEQPRFETAVGSIEPIHQSFVASKILAKVAEVNVSAGQMVAEGEVLVRLVDDELKSRLRQAEASLESATASAEQARANLRRAEQLRKGNAISQAEYETVETAVRTSQANLNQAARAVDEAKVFLEYATIDAPYAGVIVDKQVQEGDTVTPGQTLLTLYDPNQMQLVANVRESFANRLKVGQVVSAKLESMDYECQATVREVVPQAEAGSRSFQVKVSGPCPPGIYSGMFGRIALPLDSETIVVIPAAAVKRVGQLALVDAVDGETLNRRSLQLGRRIGNDVEVLSGLRAGERVAMSADAVTLYEEGVRK